MTDPDVAYRSRIRIERLKGPWRRAHLPMGETVDFGVHDEVAQHYGVDSAVHQPHSTTLDYFVAATAG